MSDPTDRAWQSTIRSRVLVAAACFALWVVAIEARLVWLQVYQRGHYVACADAQQKDTVDVPARRGDIVDRNGQALALNVDAQSIWVLTKLVKDPERTLDRVCQALGGCRPEERTLYANRLRRKNAFVPLRPRIAPADALRVAALELPGISLRPEPRRFYPNRDLAAHVIGYVGVEGKGYAGVEATYDSEIAGQPGSALLEADAKGNVFATRIKRAPIDGATVELTIDHVVQLAAEQALQEAVDRHQAAGGTAIVMEPRTGEILALANYPTYNPNNLNASPVEALRNSGVQDFYEPGSIFKVVTASAAIEEQAFRIDEPIDVSAGGIRIGSRKEIKDVHASGVLSFTDVIVHSSNAGAVKIGLRLGPERLSRYVHRFGFGTRICPDVLSNSPGRVSPGHWSDSTLASVSMGYEIGVTPLQMVTAVSSIANGGLLVRPHLVRALRIGSSRAEVKPLELGRSIAPETSSELIAIMEQVVQRGTGTAAAVPGYTVAGKTGTAAKIVGGAYSKRDYRASFVGFVPSRQPAFAMIVMIDAPHAGGYYGGAVAAPVFKRIAEAALRHLRVPQTLNPVPPIVVTASAEEPLPAMTPATGRVPASSISVVTGAPRVPDVRGLGAREANRRLARLGLVPRLTGDGVVIDQDPAAGTPLEPGTVCRLWLDRITVPPPSSPPQ